MIGKMIAIILTSTAKADANALSSPVFVFGLKMKAIVVFKAMAKAAMNTISLQLKNDSPNIRGESTKNNGANKHTYAFVKRLKATYKQRSLRKTKPKMSASDETYTNLATY